MNARVPKEWNELSKSAQRKLAEFCISLINEQEGKDMRIVLELIIKMICCLLYDTEGFDETKLFLFVGNFKMVFNEQQKLVSKGEQRKYDKQRGTPNIVAIDGHGSKVLRTGICRVLIIPTECTDASFFYRKNLRIPGDSCILPGA